MRHPLVVIVVFPLLTLPVLFLTFRNNPQWSSGILSDSTVGMWAWLAGIYGAFILWALIMRIRFQVQRSAVRKWLAEGQGGSELVGKVDQSVWDRGSGTPVSEGVLWLVVDIRSRSAHVCRVLGDHKSIISLREAATLVDIGIAPSSFTGSADSDIVLRFEGHPDLHTTLIGPYTKIFPLNLRALERHLARIRDRLIQSN